jgi:hypothetical protein
LVSLRGYLPVICVETRYMRAVLTAIAALARQLSVIRVWFDGADFRRTKESSGMRATFEIDHNRK